MIYFDLSKIKIAGPLLLKCFSIDIALLEAAFVHSPFKQHIQADFPINNVGLEAHFFSPLAPAES